MDGLQHRVRTALKFAQSGIGPDEARFLERRVIELRSEVDAAPYDKPERLRLLASCAEAFATARWARGYPTVPLTSSSFRPACDSDGLAGPRSGVRVPGLELAGSVDAGDTTRSVQCYRAEGQRDQSEHHGGPGPDYPVAGAGAGREPAPQSQTDQP